MASSLDIIDHSPHHPDPSPPIPTASNLILIDNYDSFTWNVYQYLVLEGATVTVYRNDQITLEELITKRPTQLVVSPGPGHPISDSGISRDAIKHFAGRIPIFGVCMGQQCIFDVYGGDVRFAGEILHGKTSPLAHDSKGVYAGMAQGLPVTRYHSLAGTHVTLPECLEVTSWIPKDDGSKGVIMGVRHKEYTVEGVQFHPESILSADGRVMIKNFLHMQGGTWADNERLRKESQADSIANQSVEKSSLPSDPKKSNILQQIYTRRREAVAVQKEIPSLRPRDLEAAHELNTAPPQIPFVDRIRQSPFDVSLMAEIKRGSPSKGIFALDIDAPSQAKKYALAGASVISVLTEPDWFKGSIEDLRAVRRVLDSMPNRPAVLRKDFIFEEYQILEARLAGADSVLLIVKMLDEELLLRLYKYSLSLGMEPLVEVQNTEEMATAVKLGSKVIGVNNRNLESFEVDLSTTSRLRSLVPKETIICALSGINTHDDVLANHKDGVNAILVGEAIMRAPDASQFIQQLCAGQTSAQQKSLHGPLFVKICGTRTPEAALAAAEAGADLIGMILVPDRKRSVSDDAAKAISKAVHDFSRPAPVAPAAIPKNAASDFFASAPLKLTSPNHTRPLLVGVFQNQPLDEIIELQKRYSLDVVQLHGHEPVEWARVIPVPILRRFTPGEPGIGVRGYHTVPLFDPGSGSGQLLDTVDVKAALKRDRELRIILAGGLDPENVVGVIKAVGLDGARILGVDVSSGVEGADGEQSLERIREFVKTAKAIR
ncbi:indole-3-glycerol phosphate synthase-domain-containing protein [Annulohypoxylon maeteangense]|uniref:indole-3-glycerol phosphate synthase-domain-containing protein n=1 Tax=Annulohypoxylon maeteangense TaxID=1927788 RepID=UPI002008B8E6|nr:indole-3-glycerol phosphate synthase-domain-containing protein [Annulohypoxylon maeteangense]KAI0887678.1 indole-3-glycerol phosphate synthase-domain-containing protein [Annulohypoxylon maeteangense]